MLIAPLDTVAVLLCLLLSDSECEASAKAYCERYRHDFGNISVWDCIEREVRCCEEDPDRGGCVHC